MRYRARLLLAVFHILVWLPQVGAAQILSQGVIDPSRSVDWSGAGVTNGIPNRTTQCGPTIAAYTGSAAAINTAITNCPSGQVVQLGSGTFNLSSGISISKSNVTLRGQGANATFLVFSGSGAGTYNSIIAIEGSFNDKDSEGNLCDWTSSYARGAMTITVANCGTTTPARGSISNLKVGSFLYLDQLDEIDDTGTIWNCASTIGQTSPCANTIQAGATRFDGPCLSGVALGTNGPGCLRTQQQGVIVTAINGNTITISPGLYMPNWRSSQKPQAWFPTTTVAGVGIENLSIDARSAGSQQTIMLANATNSWVKGVRGVYANRSHVRVLGGSHITIRDSYFYQNLSHSSVSYGAELMGGWDNLIENNIFQQDTDSEPSCSSACAGNVIAHNYNINNVWGSAGWMQAGFYLHAGGTSFNLWEGNIGPGYNADQVHGTHHFDTIFRNYLIGNQTAGCGSAGPSTCTAQTIPIQLYSGSRYFNVIGNVLGQSGYHTNYDCEAQTGSSCSQAIKSIFVLGYTNNSGGVFSSITGFCTSPSCATRSNYDPQTPNYLFRWGNYDVVTNAARWCGNSSNTGWSTTCGSTSEVPTGLAQYAQPVPSTQTLPTSLYRSGKPLWWGTLPYPAIGPDVTGGPGPGGHAYANPAKNCFLNVMGGPADGTGALLAFDASSCYGSTFTPPPPAPSAPSNLRIIK